MVIRKIYGKKIGSPSRFCEKVREAINDLSPTVVEAIDPLLNGLEGIEIALKNLTGKLIELGKKMRIVDF